MLNLTKEVKNFKKQVYGTASAKELADDHGIRIRRSKDGENALEFATSYFYTSQATTKELVQEFVDWLVEPVTPVFLGDVIYRGKSWPKTSWATVSVSFEAKE